MNSRTLIGVVLIVLGILALAYQGFSYTVPKKAVDLGPVQITREERHNVALPPILGGLAILGGVLVLATGRRKS